MQKIEEILIFNRFWAELDLTKLINVLDIYN